MLVSSRREDRTSRSKAALLGCSVVTGDRRAAKVGPATRSQSSCGGIGSTRSEARLAGAERIIGVDRIASSRWRRVRRDRYGRRERRRSVAQVSS
jgi:Zn-dependent alcohol dehydrogenase